MDRTGFENAVAANNLVEAQRLGVWSGNAAWNMEQVQADLRLITAAKAAGGEGRVGMGMEMVEWLRGAEVKAAKRVKEMARRTFVYVSKDGDLPQAQLLWGLKGPDGTRLVEVSDLNKVFQSVCRFGTLEMAQWLWNLRDDKDKDGATYSAVAIALKVLKVL